MDRYGLICRVVLGQPDVIQGELAAKLNVSLGTVNGLAKECMGRKYIAERTEGKDGFRHGSKRGLKEKERRPLE